MSLEYVRKCPIIRHVGLCHRGKALGMHGLSRRAICRVAQMRPTSTRQSSKDLTKVRQPPSTKGSYQPCFLEPGFVLGLRRTRKGHPCACATFWACRKVAKPGRESPKNYQQPSLNLGLQVYEQYLLWGVWIGPTLGAI